MNETAGDGTFRQRKIDPRQRRTSLVVKAALLSTHLASAAAQIGLTSFPSSIFSFDATIVGVARVGSLDASGTASLEIVDHGTIDAGFMFALANLFAFFGLLFAMFFHRYEIDAAERGAMPYVWLALLGGQVFLMLGVELTAGIGAWVELTLLGTLTSAILFVGWLGTHGNFRARHDYGWAYLPMMTLIQIPLALAILNSTVVKFRNAGPSSHIVVPILALLDQLVALVFNLVIYVRSTATYTSLMALYVSSSLGVIVISWLGLAMFASDGITY